MFPDVAPKVLLFNSSPVLSRDRSKLLLLTINSIKTRMSAVSKCGVVNVLCIVKVYYRLLQEGSLCLHSSVFGVCMRRKKRSVSQSLIGRCQSGQCLCAAGEEVRYYEEVRDAGQNLYTLQTLTDRSCRHLTLLSNFPVSSVRSDT